MVEHLALIFGTEKDRVNCPLYFKIGACRHGPRCSRHHTQPSISPTLLHSNMNQRIDNAVTPGLDSQGQPIDPSKIQEHFENLYQNIFYELSKLVMYILNSWTRMMLQMKGRYYDGHPIIIDFSPFTDFHEAKDNACDRGS
ncbi:hypothetical protein OPV22_000955 [Ensete ventricosum]|uniref:C3H1-type domain-containing protein n=1 Tax=Ensete ventricosum TaxID=4639 RepID=A0AAV8RRC5_ENSVE|nr:hypothetical protein OPV22_000955 [Ensete ventricosum]